VQLRRARGTGPDLAETTLDYPEGVLAAERKLAVRWPIPPGTGPTAACQASSLRANQSLALLSPDITSGARIALWIASAS
jgi:hypothetical protein